MDRKQLLKYLRDAQGEKTQIAFATSLNCSAAYLSDIYAGRREPGPKVLAALGFQRHITYKKWRKDD